MQRRSFLKHSGLSLAFLACSRSLAAGSPRPNLLIIHTDEHNFRTLGCYRKVMSESQAFVWGKGVAVETPHIDVIAARGAVCTSFYATTPVCSPSRASFVSGCYPQNTPVTTNNIALDDGVVTFAETLRQNGYATGYAGKWHIDGGGKPQWAPKRQFGFADNRYMFNRGHWKMLEDTPQGPRVAARKNGKPTYDVKGATTETFTTDFLADKTIAFIHANKQRPFCYMVSIPDPHGPNTVRAPYDTMFDKLQFACPRTMGKPSEGLPTWGKQQAGSLNNASMALYFGMVKCIDDNVGRILAALREDGILERTIVVFTSDHGDLCGEHGKHNKGVPYEASAKVPFVIAYPGKIQPGTVIHEALSCVDFLPTILGLMGVKTAGKEEGRDASALLTSGRAPDGWKDITFMRGTGSGDKVNWIAAVTSRYKLVYAPTDDPWLFDLEKDPDEMHNAYADEGYERVVRDMASALREYGHTHNDPYTRHDAIARALDRATRRS